MDHTKKSSYIFSIDAMRVIAILGVILIHLTTKTLQNLDHNVTLLPLTLFLNQAARFAVPLFFLISGFVLELNYTKSLSYKSFFKKRASRILIPYIFWSSAYFLVGWGYNIDALFSLRFLSDLMLGTASYHLYFIPTLIVFYLLFPVFHKFIVYLKYPYFFYGLLVFQILLSIKDYYFGQIQLQYSLRIALLNFSVFVIGMLVSHYRERIVNFVKKYLKLMSIMLIATITFIFFHVYDLTVTNKTSGYIYNQYGPLNYIYTFLLSSLLYYALERNHIFRNGIITLSKLSFFVFFVHIFILEFVWNSFVSPLMQLFGKNILAAFWFDTVFFILISTISFGIAYFVHKIPNLSKVTG